MTTRDVHKQSIKRTKANGSHVGGNLLPLSSYFAAVFLLSGWEANIPKYSPPLIG